jgi:hypothetical protein
MNERILKIMKQADYAAPEIAKRAQSLAELMIKDCIQTLIDNGYDDAAQCLQDLNFRVEKCLECDRPAVWIRHTQFAGDHPYCDTHARQEKDFGEDDSYTYWTEVEK